MRNKSIWIGALAGIVLAVLVYLGLTCPLPGGGAPTRFRAEGVKLQQLQNEEWTDFEVVGVNMGSGCPGAFPNEGAIDQETFGRWFEEIAAMHANTVRVYQLQAPAFYSALAKYNESHEDKLYLIQTMDFPEAMMFSHDNVLHPQALEFFQKEAERVVDALHGDLITVNREADRLDCYLSDVSDYVLGYLLGIEWDEVFVDFTCRMNPTVAPYQGQFLRCTEEATPFESFLACWGDRLLSYEDERYGCRRLVSFCNWPDTDPLINELDLSATEAGTSVEGNTEVLVDVEHIRCTDEPQAGVFAAYNVYPYYPLFLQLGDYTRYTNEKGQHAPYEGYLKALVQHHTCPVVISEYGLPSSRSVAHDDIWRGLTHGGLNEQEQGRGAAALFRDIRKAGCAGSLVFTWQDEWYKRTWNEQAISDPDGRAFWSNVQSSEQSFGLLAFEPGEEGETVYPDGELSDWSEEDVVWQEGNISLSVQTDARFIHFLIQGYDPKEGVSVALDTLPGSGVTEQEQRTFSQGVEFLLTIDRRGRAALRVHDDYSLLLYSMADKMNSGLSEAFMEDLSDIYEEQGMTLERSDRFHVVSRASGSVFSALHHALHVDEVGRLQRGNGSPESPAFDSNADYCLRGNTAEIRIPWQLLNFRDPSRGTIVGDLWENGHAVRDVEIDEFYAALFVPGETDIDDFAVCPLRHWKEPVYHERLKASYYILQKAFKGVEQP